MTLRDELYQISEEALKQQKMAELTETQKKVSEYLTQELKKVAAEGQTGCIIFLDILICEGCRLELQDVVDFASANEIDCAYPKMINVTYANLSWDKK